MAFRFQPGFISQRTAIALNELAQIVEKLEPLLRRQGESAERTQERLVVKITAVDGSGAYSGTEQGYTTSGAYEDLPNGRVFSPSDKPIYERNGRTLATFPVYYEVSLRQLVGGTPTYEFDAGSADAIIDISGRSGSITDVTALQILRGVVSGTASAAVFTPDDATETLPGDWKAAATQTLAGGKTINRFTALTGPVLAIGNNGVGSTTDPSFYAEGAIFIGNAANGFNASHALAMYFDDTTGFSLIQHADASGGTSIDMREALAGVSASGGVVSIGGTAPTFYCRVIQASLKFKVGAGAGADGVTGTGGGGDTVVGGIITALGSGPTITNLTYSGSQAATGDISPAQLVANTNDWNPTGW